MRRDHPRAVKVIADFLNSAFYLQSIAIQALIAARNQGWGYWMNEASRARGAFTYWHFVTSSLGVIMILFGTALTQVMIKEKPQLVPLGISMIAGGIILVPLTTNYLSKRWAVFSRWYLPFLIAGISLLAGFVSTGVVLQATGAVPTTQRLSQRPSLTDVAPENRSQLLARIESLISAGDQSSTTKAMALIHERFTPDEIKTDPHVGSLLQRAIAADHLAGRASREQEYAERVTDHWLPQVQAIPTSSPTSANELWKRVGDFDELGRAIGDGLEFKDGEGFRARERLRSALTAKQRAAFPPLRQAYGQITRSALWRFDVNVEVSGGGNRTLRLTGVRFAANQNILDTQQSIQRNLEKLRFSKASYEAFSNSGGYVYDIPSARDEDVGYWAGSVFTKASID